ncbi:BREX-1 system phosphatase PglZ type A [Methanolobus psychrotolerans]|uniref:BREX-1 system phosphatase PglZ type A n=1 Tax=Methanolobus psychrotolerans TaxID=1874706 RepID=UPI000B91A280|nr:BREX-1 system phosphatase PglZ type A [Methanolobus psychrotolerans]
MLNPEKTTQSILKKFETLGEFEKRKIVFWYDKDPTADEEGLAYISEALVEKGIKLHVLDNNFFATKKMLEKDDTESSYLIYSDEAERDPELNWLLDIQLYSGRFENSRISDIKSEFGIGGYDLDRFLEKHQQFFASKKRVVPLKRMYQADWRDEEFTLGFLGVLSGSATTDLKEIVRKILINSLDESSNTVWADIVRFELVEEFWDMVNRYFGYKSEEPTLKKLFLSFVITHISRNTDIDLKKYKAYSNSLSNECEIFIKGWMDNSKDSGFFDEYCRLLLEDNNGQLNKYLNTEIKKHDITDYMEAESLELFDKHIVRKIVDELDNDKEDFETYLDWIANRKTKHWYPDFENIYNALEYAVKLHQFAKEFNEENLNDQNLNRFFRNYTERYYLMDYYYRKFYYHHDKDREKEDLKTTREGVEKLYNNRLLDKLLTRWSELISKEMDGRWNIELIDRQDEFYKLYIKNIINRNDKDKIAVVISDAMRYEVAAELQDVLNKDTRGTVELKYMTGSLPSYTKLGMASLLPHEKLEYRNQSVFADGISTEGTDNRGKILEKMTPDSIAISYEELMNITRDKAREQFKGIRLFYIYHDKIDATGDHSASEHGVFNAAEDTISDVKKIIEKLTNFQILNNLIVTADHGFIYQRDALESYDKVETGNFDKEKIIASSKRFILSEEDIELMNVHKFNMNYVIRSEAQKEIFAYVPQADLRFKMQGANKNFVHGGAAPQEIVVPVLKYTYNRVIDLDRKGIKHGKVGLAVINPSRKITSSPFSINILQTERVTDKLLPRRFRIALWDMDGDEFKVSDEKRVIAEGTSDEASARQYKVTLTLSGEVENKVYYIRLIDEDPTEINKEIIDPMPFEVDLLIVDDF